MKDKENKNILISRIFLIILTIVTLILLFFLVNNQMIEIIKLARLNDREGMEEFINSLGFWGKASIVLIEGLQMLVVFIPAEFVQLSAAICFPFFLAVGLCVLGVFFGATVIYLLVNLFKFDHKFLSKSNKKITQMAMYQKKERSTQVLMYLLFIMPIIPFGAICYFASSKKIGYWKYIFTCVTGVIPSIVTSYIMGSAFVVFSSKDLPLWALILIIIALAAILFLAVILIIKKLFYKKDDQHPNSFVYSFFYNFFNIFIPFMARVKLINQDSLEVSTPSLILCNHQSFYDFYYVAKMFYPYRLSFVVNSYYYRNKFFRKQFAKLNTIKKKLFTADPSTIINIFKAIKNNNNVVIFPEGRLSIDGTNYNNVENIGALVKKVRIPVNIINIYGAYSVTNKWSKKSHRGPVRIENKALLKIEDIDKMTSEEINSFIDKNLFVNEFTMTKKFNMKYHSSKKALGLENVLYYCPHCQKEFSFKSDKNSLICSHCGETFTINKFFSFEKNEYNINTIHDFYLMQKSYETAQMKINPVLKTKVKIRKCHPIDDRLDEYGEGVCSLEDNVLTFEGSLKEEKLAFKVSLTALAFSCNEEFECYFNNELYYFYPENPQVCVKWALRVDIFHQGVNNEKE